MIDFETQGCPSVLFNNLRWLTSGGQQGLPGLQKEDGDFCGTFVPLHPPGIPPGNLNPPFCPVYFSPSCLHPPPRCLRVLACLWGKRAKRNCQSIGDVILLAVCSVLACLWGRRAERNSHSIPAFFLFFGGRGAFGLRLPADLQEQARGCYSCQCMVGS